MAIKQTRKQNSDMFYDDIFSSNGKLQKPKKGNKNFLEYERTTSISWDQYFVLTRLANPGIMS